MPESSCVKCGHAEPHDGGGIGVCRHPGCGCDGPGEARWWEVPLWALHADEGEALAVLTKMACPAPCVGHRDPGGEDWHELCERKARTALAVLRFPPAVASVGQVEPTSVQFLAALAAWDAVCADLGVSWEARQPVQGEATPKVFAYRLAKAALNASSLPRCAACGRPVPGEVCQRPDCPGFEPEQASSDE